MMCWSRVMFSEIMKRRLRAQVVEGMSACSANTKRSGLSVMEKLFCLHSWEQPLSRLHLSRTAFDNIDHRNYSLLQTSVYGISGIFPSWFKSYRTNTNRTMTISMARVQGLACECLLWYPTGLLSGSYSLHSLLCTSLIFADRNSFCRQPVFSW